MGTPFSEVYDLALMVMQDYRLDYLYKDDKETFYNQLQGWLVKAVTKFDGSVTPLEYDLKHKWFIYDLSGKEKDILSEFMVILWFEGVINDITQVNLKLQGRDRRVNSEASNLKEKSEYIDRLREKVRQDITDYQLNNFDSFAW